MNEPLTKEPVSDCCAVCHFHRDAMGKLMYLTLEDAWANRTYAWHCHRNGPTGAHDRWGTWPKTIGTNWCGEFQRRTDSAEGGE